MNLNELIRSFVITSKDSFSFADIIFALVIPFLLTYVVSFIYRKHVREHVYSHEFIVSLFLFSVVVILSHEYQ